MLEYFPTHYSWNLAVLMAEQLGGELTEIDRACRPLRAIAERADARNDPDAQAAWIADIGRSFGPHDPPDEIRRALLNTHVLSLQTTAGLLDLSTAVRVADAIVKSRQVDVYGVGGSALTALETEARLYRIGINVHTWAEVHNGLTSAAILDRKCVAIGISNTGRTDETIQMLTVAKASGAYTVAITGNPDSPLARIADDVLIAASPDGYLQPADLSARHCQLFVVDLLYLLVAQSNFDRTTRLLAASGAAVAPRRRPVRGTASSLAVRRAAPIVQRTE